MCAVNKKMRPPFHRNFVPTADASKQENRPKFYEARPTLGTSNIWPETVVVRSPFDSAIIPKDNGSLPLREVNDLRFKTNIVGVGKRFDRTSVQTPLYGPLSAMARVDDERVEGERKPKPMVHAF
jgi:hypothetical protein